MAPYQYEKLDAARQEIRLLTLLPGNADEDLCAYITHVPFNDPRPKRSTRASVKEVQASLPAGWDVYETLSGRYIFWSPSETSWSHPLQNVQRSFYENAIDDDGDDNVPTYEALSYTWGASGNEIKLCVSTSGPTAVAPTTGSKRLHVRNLLHLPSRKRSLRPESPSCTLDIRPNLAACLRHLRLAKEKRTLWIDAVCINQNDTLERSAEIGRMGSIFQLAQRVVVWLGLDSRDTHLAFQALAHLGIQVDVTQHGHIVVAPGADTTWIRPEVEMPYSDADWSAIQDIVDRQWFDRLWVLQEITMANSEAVLQCSDHVMDWTLFRKALVVLTGNLHLPSARMQNRLRHLYSFWHTRTDLTPTAALHRTASLECSEPADHVYAILSLTKPWFRDRIIPDYTLPIEKLFKDTLIAIIEEEKTLQPLARCHLANRQINAPSWVPDWSMTTMTKLFDIRIRAAGSSRCFAKVIDEETLSIKGCVISAVQSVSSAYTAGDDMISTLTEWRSMSMKVAKDSRLKDLVMTVALNRSKEFWLQTKLPSRAQLWRAFNAVLSRREISSDQDHDGVNSWFLSQSSTWMMNRHLIVTDDGQFGLSPLGVEAGDVIALFLGLRTHLCLRRTVQDPSRFKVIGECYIYGQEDGVGFLGPLPPDWSFYTRLDREGCDMIMYEDLSTGRITNRDPRLGPLPIGWEIGNTAHESEPESLYYRNIHTEKETYFDPRLSPEALAERGIKIEDFLLI